IVPCDGREPLHHVRRLLRCGKLRVLFFPLAGDFREELKANRRQRAQKQHGHKDFKQCKSTTFHSAGDKLCIRAIKGRKSAAENDTTTAAYAMMMGGKITCTAA